MIFFSIIIPTYNRANFLVETIESVISQDFKEIEVIVVDDGSTDNTNQIVNEIKKNDSRIKYIYQKNSERAIARNVGASHANGNFLIFLDSDDYFSSSSHLNDIFIFLKNNNFKCALYFTGATLKNNSNKITTKYYDLDELKNFDFFVNESIIPARVCLSKQILCEFQFDNDCIIVEDTVLWTSIMVKYPVIYIPIFSVVYTIHDGNSVNVYKSNAYYKRLKGLKKLFYIYSVGIKISEKTKSIHINRCYLGIYDYYFSQNKKNKSLFWLLLSIIKFPSIELKHKIKLFFKLL
jgi:glycosyltransferase involved in cell wall biosynthesis